MRVQAGSKNNNAKLTEIQVGEAKGYLVKGLTLAETQQVTGIDRRNLWAIYHTKSWKHVEPNLSVVLPDKNPRPTEKRCPNCCQVKPLTQFHKSSRPPLFVKYCCRECSNALGKKRNQKIRKAVLVKYGGACTCCGESQPEFLSVDHVNGGGSQERRLLKSTGIMLKLYRSDVLPEYRLLCFNCNCSRGFSGYCPHTLEEKEAQ
jgi:hypothetical protein